MYQANPPKGGDAKLKGLKRIIRQASQLLVQKVN